MRAFVFDSYRQPLHVAEVAEPVVGDHDVLVEVAAAGVNKLDDMIRTGEFQQLLRIHLPQPLGHDVAGTVLRTGAEVTGFAVGDRVFARPRDGRIGTWAERIAVHEDDLAPAPATTTPVEAASLPLVALTAWQALVEIGQVQPGQKVLVHGGAGGVGTIAIQLAKHLGAEVATTASARDADFLRELGADTVLDYRTQDFATELTGYDLVLDNRGGDTLQRSLTVLRRGGVVVGIVGPPTPAFARRAGLNPVLRIAMRLLSRRVRARARALGVRYEFLFMRADGAQLRQISGLVDAGVLRPVVGATFPFEQTPQALASMGHAGYRGKAVVTVP